MRERLMEETNRPLENLQRDPTSFSDEGDRASHEEGFNFELQTRDRETQQIRMIDLALKSLEIGTYGYCHECGEKIGTERLDARPTSTLCIDCKTHKEQIERGIRST